MSEETYKKAARIIVKSGMLPFPISDTLIDIMKLIYNDSEIDFINKAFRRKASLTLEELKKFSKMSEEEILKNAQSLAKKGAVFISTSSSGLEIYRILPLIMVGVFEYQFMKKIEYTEKEKTIAELFKILFDEMRDLIQDRYEIMLPMFKQLPPVDRTIPIYENAEGKEILIEVNEEVEPPIEQVLPTQKIKEIIEKFDDIAIAHCFCRHHKDLLGDSCKIDAPRETCFTLGKSARFVVNQGFGRMISKEEALDILKMVEEKGFIHKAYHPLGNISRDETSICNCCKCCCGTFLLWKEGVVPMVNATNYLANINQDLCNGSGICLDKCPVDAIELNDEGKAKINELFCIGCGVCSHFCPESAISLIEGQRTVYVPPPKIKQ